MNERIDETEINWWNDLLKLKQPVMKLMLIGRENTIWMFEMKWKQNERVNEVPRDEALPNGNAKGTNASRHECWKQNEARRERSLTFNSIAQFMPLR